MRVLITGGSGFIGSHVVDRLREHGVTPRIFDLMSSPHHAPGEVETVLGSLLDPEALRLAMAGCHAVIHLAAVADVKDVYEEPAYAEDINTRGTLNVLDAARRSGIERVVYGSTTWVYSDCREDSVDEDTTIAAPSHLYTATKLAGETYCVAYRKLYGIPYTILRFGIPYGPRARAGAVVPIFVNKALAGEPLTVAGDGLQFRKFVYVEDLAEGIVLGLKPIAVDRIYNLDGSERVTILDIARAVSNAVGDVEIIHTEARPGDFAGKEVSSERARDELGWEAQTPFTDGVARYVAWRRERVAGEQRSWEAVDQMLLA
ncbi:MAG TPA: NAD-dependent epimerase/dehydratase family protein [Solirubrobacteraceae bacterium]|nr:NAD-dependent epimerase/dehydratase family protein [Solirubrobacteraceae bacterium]